MAPVTGMLTMYEDQLRFDKAAVDSSSPVDREQPDDSMSRVRLNRNLITSVEISDNSPRPQLLSQSVSHS